MKPGYKTTEFWLTLATQVGALVSTVSDNLPPKYAAIAATVAAVGYALSRGLAKVFPPKPPA